MHSGSSGSSVIDYVSCRVFISSLHYPCLNTLSLSFSQLLSRLIGNKLADLQTDVNTVATLMCSWGRQGKVSAALVVLLI